jgi:type II secretory pathway predicted ATPase ExeA
MASMYLNHWNLNQAPFANVPAGNMFYRSPQHEEALQRLFYVIESRRGVAMLTGEVGCGKTTVIKALASQLKKDAVQFHMISNPALPPKQLLQTILLKLGGNAANGESKALLLNQLHQILADAAAAGRKTVLVIDEAHVIAKRETLDELRMLLNFQSDDEFLVTLILLGQPPLLRNIAELQPLKERIAIKYNLEPLDFFNTMRYVVFRLKSAGSARGLFTRQAIHLLYESTGGIPLRINNLCDRCLLIGVLQNASALDGRIVRDAIEDMGT